ncbi:MAG: IclR family transcriptional regulator, partial [Pseudomonadota bacterium]
ENLVQQDGQRKVYLLGKKVFDLVRDADDRFDLQALALDEMLHLYSLYGANVTLGVPSGLEVVYLRMLEAKPVANPVPKPGMREPIHCSASGKALTAFLPDKIIDAKLADYDFVPFTERTIGNPEAFKASLETVRKDGYAFNDREEYEYFTGISAPIFDYQGNAVAVLNIWSLETLHPISEMHTWSYELIASARRVTEIISGVPPDPEKLRGG